MTIVSGHFESIRKLLNDRAFIEDKGDVIDLIFPKYGDAYVFKSYHERDVGAMYAGKLVRWLWSEWNNKPCCQIHQVATQAKMQKWSHDRFMQEDENAKRSCQCYGCKGTAK